MAGFADVLWADLIRRKDFHDLTRDLAHPFQRVGVRRRGVYVDMVAVVEADGADEEAVEAWCAAGLQATCEAPKRFGLPRVSQPCMVLLLVFRNGCDPGLAAFICRQRRYRIWGRGAVVVPWVADLERGTVTPHRNPVSWFPPIIIAHDGALGAAAYPGLGYLQRFVRWYLDLARTEADAWRLLIVTASPLSHKALPEGREVRAIQQALSSAGRRFRLDHLPAATLDDLAWKLKWGRYRLLHVCGHGVGGGLYLCDTEGDAHLVPEETFRDVVAGSAPALECVFLNACYAAGRSPLLQGLAPAVIGSEEELSDDLAYRFASRFYGELARTEAPREAYRNTAEALLAQGVHRSRMPRLYP